MLRPFPVLVLLAALSGACGSAPQAPPVEPKPETERPPPAEPTVPELQRLLLAVPAEQSVLAAAPPPLSSALSKQVAQLSEQDQATLRAGQDPVVALRPLLYAAAGGQDPEVIALVYASAAAANEIVSVSGEQSLQIDVVEASNALSRAAAQSVLRTRAADLGPGVEHRAEHLEQVAFAASVLSRPDIERLALNELEQHFPDPRWTSALARLDARALDAAAAERRITSLSGLPAMVTQVLRGEMQAASRLSGANPADSAEVAVQQARDWMRLGRHEDALAALVPFADQRGKHLGLAAAFARATSRASACPALLGAAATSEHLCRAAWVRLLGQSPMDYLTTAWESGQGRDVQAIEIHIGLSYVVPQMYGIGPTGAPADIDAIVNGFAAMQRVAQESGEVAPHFRAVALMAEALSAVFDPARLEEPQTQRLAKEERTRLTEAAQKLLQAQSEDPWTHAAALTVATMTSREDSLAPLLTQLKPHVHRDYESTLGTLLLWDMLADGDSERFTDLEGFLGEVATNQDASAFERSRWLFLWAEADAHLRPGEKSYATLSKVANQLTDERVPLALRLRAHIDLAGLAVRNGDLAGAGQALARVVATTPRSAVSTHDEQELLVAATAYSLVLEVLQSTGEQRQSAVQKYTELMESVGRARAAPPTLELWMLLWRAEFDYLMAKDACKGRAACERKAKALKAVRPEGMDQAIGPRSAELLRRGVVPVGGVQIEFRYLGQGQLAPRLQVAPRFLMAHVPTLPRAR